MAWDGTLPFERGNAFKDGFTATTAVPNVKIAGKSYPFADDEGDEDGGHGTGGYIELRPMINRATAAITRNVGLRLSTLSSTSPLNAVNGNVAAAGIAGVIMDDRYTSGYSVAVGDIFWTVRRGGPTKARCSTRGGNIAANDPLIFSTGGKLRKMRTAEGHIIARALEACTTENVFKNVHVNEPGMFDEVA